MMKKNELSLPAGSVKEIFSILDSTYGITSILYLICVIIAYNTNQVTWHAVFISAILILANILYTQYTIRSKSPVRAEIFRFVGNITVICPLTVLWIKGPFENYWYAYLIIAVGAAGFGFQLTKGHLLGLILNFLGVLSYIVVNYFFVEEVNWFLVAIHSGIIITLGILFVQTLNLMRRSYANERQKSIKIQEALRQLNEAQNKFTSQFTSSSLGEMATGIAHEIDHPLSIVGTHLKRLEKKCDYEDINEEELREFCIKTYPIVLEISKVVKSFKNISITRNDLSIEPFILNELLTDILSIYYQKFKRSGARIEIDHKQFSFLIYTNRAQLGQALLALIDNSYDAIQKLDEKWIRIEYAENQLFHVIKIIDSGTGIKSDIRDKIFGRFFTTKKLNKGAGMGLNMVRKILQNLHGEISLDLSSSNTSFHIKLPKKKS